MIVQNTKSSNIEGDDFEGIDASIDKNNLSFLFDIVSKQMYRRPINSIVREITSNCFDSHIEAKVDDPVTIIIKSDEGGDYIIFKDVGVGMSPERMKKTYSKYFSSTKRDSNDQIGMFGLGSKSPLSYTDLFYLTTNYNNKRYEYQIHTGNKTPRIDLLIEDDTNEHNGTEVKIYIKNTTDLNSFITACKSELLYFDNVYIDSYYEFENEYSILEYKTFKYRHDTKYSNSLHLIIGKVPYPISWDEININPIYIPCGLKFNIGELQVTPERESIRYIDIIKEDQSIISTKQIILDKIQEFKSEIEELFNKKIDNIFEDYSKYLKYQEEINCNLRLDENIYLNITSLVKKPEGVFLPLIDFKGVLPKNLFFEYKTESFYSKSGRSKKDFERDFNYQELSKYLYLIPSKSGKLNNKKLQYLFYKAKDLTNSSQFYTIKFTPNSLKNTLNYLGIKIKSKTYNYSITNATKQLKLYRDFVAKEIKRLTYNIDDIQIDQDWLKEFNLSSKTKVDKEENSFLVYNYGLETLAVKEYITIDSLYRFTGFIIYGFEEDEDLIRNFRTLLLNSKYGYSRYIDQKKCRLYKVAKRTEKYLLELKNKKQEKIAIYIYDFMGNNKIFKRFATVALIEEESKAIKLKGFSSKEENNNLFSNLMEEIFPPVADTLKDLDEVSKEYAKICYTRVEDSISDKFFKEIVTISREYNLYDQEMINAHKKLEKYVKGLELINYIVCKKNAIPYIVDFLKLKNKKVDQIWIEPEQYQLELIKESLDKICYYLSIYNSNYIFKGNRITYSKNRKDGLTKEEKTKEVLKLQNLQTIYQGLLNYQIYDKAN